MDAFRQGWVHECIVTTYHEDQTPNAAPMGVRKSGDGGEILIRVHTTTDTWRNICRDGVFCVNVIYDPLVFIRAAVLGHGVGPGEAEFGPGDFGKCRGINAPYLTAGSAYYEVEAVGNSVYDRHDGMGVTEFAEVRGRVVGKKVRERSPRAYNRGLGAAVELAVELSRGKKDGVGRYLAVMEKTMPPGVVEEIRSFLEAI